LRTSAALNGTLGQQGFSFAVMAKFGGANGTGKRTDARICDLVFAKQ
jgi:hypothetical protein